MYRNVASQKIALFAFTPADGLAKTGDAAQITPYLSKDFGTVTALTDTSATEMSSTNAPGWYWFDVSQTESNAHALLFTGKSSTSGVAVVGSLVYTIDWALKSGKAISAFEFLMTDSTNHNPAARLTVTPTRSIDGGAFGAGTLGAVSAVSNGIYKLDIPAADLTGTVITLRFTASGADDLFTTLIMEP